MKSKEFYFKELLNCLTLKRDNSTYGDWNFYFLEESVEFILTQYSEHHNIYLNISDIRFDFINLNNGIIEKHFRNKK